jgi:hypothetical protein
MIYFVQIRRIYRRWKLKRTLMRYARITYENSSSLSSTSPASQLTPVGVPVLWFKEDSGGREILVTIVRGLVPTGTEADLYISSSRKSSELCDETDSHSTTLTASFFCKSSAYRRRMGKRDVRVLSPPVPSLCGQRTLFFAQGCGDRESLH